MYTIYSRASWESIPDVGQGKNVYYILCQVNNKPLYIGQVKNRYYMWHIGI